MIPVNSPLLPLEKGRAPSARADQSGWGLTPDQVFVMIALLIFPILLGLSMTRELDHDEHQHVAAGALIAREGLLPYRDFPHFHTPYLPLIYGVIFRFTDHLLLAARFISVLCGTIIVSVVGCVAYGQFRVRDRWLGLAATVGAVLLCLTSASFTHATGGAWNHEPALCFTLLAFLAHLRGLNTGRQAWLIGSGILLGVAIGLRITCAPLVAPFGLALVVLSRTPGRSSPRFLCFCGGLLIGLAPLIAVVSLAPEQAWFSTFGFPAINITYRIQRGEKVLTLFSKFQFLLELILYSECAIFVAGMAPIVASLAARWGERRRSTGLWFTLLILPFLLIGAVAPTPSHLQYFAPFVPFLLLAGIYALADIPLGSVWFRRAAMISAACVFFSAAGRYRPFIPLRGFFAGEEWVTMKVHRQSQELRTLVKQGRVLTLAPIYPLEAGLGIYPGFSTGPFAWRISPLVPADRASRNGIVTPETLTALLTAVPPAGIQIGFDIHIENSLNGFGKGHHYQPFQLCDGTWLWVASTE